MGELWVRAEFENLVLRLTDKQITACLARLGGRGRRRQAELLCIGMAMS